MKGNFSGIIASDGRRIFVGDRVMDADGNIGTIIEDRGHVMAYFSYGKMMPHQVGKTLSIIGR